MQMSRNKLNTVFPRVSAHALISAFPRISAHALISAFPRISAHPLGPRPYGQKSAPISNKHLPYPTSPHPMPSLSQIVEIMNENLSL